MLLNQLYKSPGMLERTTRWAREPQQFEMHSTNREGYSGFILSFFNCNFTSVKRL